MAEKAGKLDRPWLRLRPRESRSRRTDKNYRSDSRYHTYRWTKESRAFREQNPLCAECLKRGRYVAAQVVDHIVPVAICEDFWDKNNWQSLCQKCNIDKGNRDKKYIR